MPLRSVLLALLTMASCALAQETRGTILGRVTDQTGAVVSGADVRATNVATGVTAGHLIRQRVLSEAKRQLVFTTQPIHDIAKELAFADPSHFARFFRKQTGTTPHEFREQRGG